MTDLDETGLAAARKEAHDLGLEALADPWAPYLGEIIRAYLEAARTSDALRDLQRMGQECEGEPDRLAVVTTDMKAESFVLKPGESLLDIFWEHLEARLSPVGPFRRQIIRCNLLRPEPVGEIVGRVEDA